ncbi:hypothetical protein AcW1_009543 [Taiwanofungus camphoratus]|nr:hypothetical protein AcV7_002663 [Antrodia cinnamomea]KAI0947899.1 hypothetical protein AcW1_009543 [Antrodia cinnamomea]
MDIGGPPEHVLRTSIFNRLDVIHLPTCEEATPTWTLQFDKDFSSFVLDPAQDLLVLWESSPIVRGVGIQLYVLSLRHGTPVWAHPLLIPLESDIRDSKFISTHKVLIAGEFLVMCTIGRNNLLLEMNVVRWSTGAVQARFSRKLDRGTFYQGFCMLSTNYFAIGIFSHPSSASAKIEVYSFDDTINPDVQAHPKPIAHVATYHLPQMHPNAYVLRFALETSPAPGLYTPEAHHSPFLFSPSSALLAITLFCMQGEVRTANDTIRCLIATRVSALLAMIVGYSHDTLGPAIFPWDSWGPASTRWFRLGPDIYKSRPLHGSRILVGNDLVDFSSLDIARDLCLRGMDGSRRAVDDSREIAIGHTGSENGEASNHRGTPSSIISMIVTEPTIIAGGNIFLKDVASKLIFRSAPCEVPRKCHHIFGGESWVGVETSPNDKVEALHILAV